MFTSKTAGFSLVEIVLGLAIIAIFTAVAVPLTVRICRQISLPLAARQSWQILHLARLNALALDEDVVVKVGDGLKLETAKQALGAYAFLPDLVVQISNQNGLGFKANGNTKYAGTLLLKNSAGSRDLTVGVGWGKITLK